MSASDLPTGSVDVGTASRREDPGMRRNTIHRSAVIGPGVRLRIRNTIRPYAVVTGQVELGDDNWIGPFASIGTPAQIRGGPRPDWDSHTLFGIRIGSRNVIREHVTLANSVHLGGHTWIGRGANLGLGLQVLQRTAIGAGVMIGMNATVTRPIPPFALAVGSPARVRSANTRGMERVAFDPAVMEDSIGERRAEAPRIAVHAPSPPERSRSLRGSFARMPSNKRRAQTNSPARIANPPITNGHPGMSGKNHPIRPSTSANTPTATIPIRITRWRSFGLCMETHCHIFVTKSELSHPEHCSR